MSYTINISEIKEGYDKFVNKTWEAVSNNDEKLVEQADGYVDWKYEGLDESDVEEKAIWVRENDVFQQLEESWYPMYNIAHVIQYGVDEAELLDIAENAPNISILEIEELDCTVIALNGCGMDFSDSIAYAYLVADNMIPEGFGNITTAYTISKKALEKLCEKQGNK